MARLVRPDVVVVTAIGSEHGRSMGNLDTTRAEKAKMVEALPPEGLAVLCGDDPNVAWMRDRTGARVVTFGRGSDNDFRAVDVHFDGAEGTRFTLQRPGGSPLAVRIRLLGEPGIRVALATLAVGLSEGLPPQPLLSSLAGLEPTRGRLQPIRLPSGALLLRDEHKSAIETMEVALDVFAALPARRKVCVFGQVSEPPGSPGPIYRHLGGRIAKIADQAIFVGTTFRPDGGDPAVLR